MGNNYVVFDVDGTLIDSRPGIATSIVYTAASAGISISIGDVGDWAYGPPLVKILERFIPNPHGHDLNQLLALFRSHYDQHGILQSVRFRGVTTALRMLEKTKIAVVFASSNDTNVVRALCRLHSIDDFALSILGSQEGRGVSAKSSTITDSIKAIRMELRNGIIVGDTEADIEAASVLTLPVVAVSYGYRQRDQLQALGPTYLADTPVEAAQVIINHFGHPSHTS